MARLRIETAPEITVYDEAFVIKAATGATAPLLQLKDSSGSVVGNITTDGTLNVVSVSASNAGTGSSALVTRSYVDTLFAGLNWHDPVAVATTTALSAVYVNGTDGVGATLTASANAALAVDGGAPAVGVSVLVKNQADAKQNGIYTVTNAGSAGTKWVLTRREDSDNSPAGEVQKGDATFVVGGSTNINCGFILSGTPSGANDNIVFGTDSLVYSQFTGTGSFTAGNGLTISENAVNVVTADSGRIVVNADSIDLGNVTVTSNSGASATTFLKNVTVDAYGRVTNKETGDVNFAGYLTTSTAASTYAPLASPALSGAPTAPTANAADNSTKIATTNYADRSADAAAGLVNTYVGSNFINKSLADAKGDIIVASADNTFGRLAVGTNGQALRANSSAASGVEWFTLAETLGLTDLSDVTITSASNNQFLKYNGSAWVNATVAEINGLTDLSDVIITTPSSKHALLYNGSAWVNETIDLGTDTNGNYMIDVSAGTGLSVSHTQGEGSTATLSINTAVTADLTTAQTMSNKTMASPVWTTQATTTSTSFNLINTTATTVNFAGAATTLAIGSSSGNTALYGNVTVGGDLTVNGTNTIINANTLVITDKNIELANVVTQTNTTASGGGLLLHGATDKTIYWQNSSLAWTSSEDWDLASGKVYKINNSTVLTSTQVLGKSVPTGTIVGTSDTQVLSNKSFTGGVTHNGATSGTTLLKASDVAGSTTITLPATTGTVVTTGDTGTVTSTMIADATIVNADISATAAIDQGKIADTVLNQQTASYTLVLGDKNKLVEISNASATTLTIPADNTVNMSTGASIIVMQTGAGQITLTPASGVTINGTPGLKLRTTWSSATLIKRAANTWVALGDLSA